MTSSLSLPAKIEALLFFRAEPVSLKKLTDLLDTDQEKLEAALNELEENLKDHGIVLMRNGDEVALGTSPSASAVIEASMKEELERDLGRASTETLSIILYRGPVSRADIDYIRGVNSSFILRHLLIRGLAERIDNPFDRRAFLYRPTFDLLRHLGVKKVEELPEYGEVRKEIQTKEDIRREAEMEESDRENPTTE